jgi:hypothetical protein
MRRDVELQKPLADHVLNDCRLGDVDAEFQQLAVILWTAPEGIDPGHAANKLTNLRGDCRPTTLVAKKARKTVTMALRTSIGTSYSCD